MKNYSIICFILFFLLPPYGGGGAFAQIFMAKESAVTFTSVAALEKIEATTTNVQAILNTKTNEVAFIIPIRGFQFKKDLMQEHFNEKYMESDKFPNASFSGKINEVIDWRKDGTYAVTSTGKMKIHGVEKEKTFQGTIAVKGDLIVLDAGFPISVKEYDVEIPRLVFQNVADTVAVKLNVNFQPYKK